MYLGHRRVLNCMFTINYLIWSGNLVRVFRYYWFVREKVCIEYTPVVIDSPMAIDLPQRIQQTDEH